MKGDTIFMIVIFLFLVLLGTISLEYSQKARFFPGIFIIAALILLMVEFIRKSQTIRKKGDDKAEAGPIANEAMESKVSRFSYVLGAAWIIGFLVSLYLFGYLISIPLFVFLYAKLHGERWLLAISLSLATVAVVYVIFVVGLERPLYKGLVFTLF